MKQKKSKKLIKYDVGGIIDDPNLNWEEIQRLNPAPYKQLPVQTPQPINQPTQIQMPTQAPSVDISLENMQNPNKSNGKKVGEAMQKVGKMAGQMLQQSIVGGVNFLNAAIPTDYKKRNFIENPIAYNPNPMGTGSQMIYEDGGYISPYKTVTRKKRGIVVTEEVPIEEQTAMQPIAQLPDVTFTGKRNKPASPVAHQKVDFIKDYDATGTLTGYTPIFHNFNDRQSVQNVMQDLPDFFGKVKVNKSMDNYGESFTGYNQYDDSDKWMLNRDKSQKPYTVEQGDPMYFKNGGLIPYTAEHGDVFEFNGPSHENGGIPLKVGNKDIEVEGGETAFIDNQNALVVLGNMKVPGQNFKFKTLGKKIAKEESIANKQFDEGSDLISKSNPYNQFGALSYNAGLIKSDAAKIKKDKLNALKEDAVIAQQEMLRLSEENNISPDKMKKGGRRPLGVNDELDRSAPSEDSYETTPLKERIINSVSKAAIKYNLQPYFLLNQTQAESGYTVDNESSAGALGFPQFMEGTAKQYGITKEQLTSNKQEDIDAVAEAQAHHMSDLLAKNNGDMKLALIAYNGGQGAVNKVRKWMGNPNATGDDIMKYWEGKRSTNPTDKTNAYQNQTYDYVNKIYEGENSGLNHFKNKYYRTKNILKVPDPNIDEEIGRVNEEMSKIDPNYTSGYNKTGILNTDDYAPKGIDLTKSQQSPTFSPNSSTKGKSLADMNKLTPIDFLGEIGALAQRPDYVDHFRYDPVLHTPYRVSYQDRLNENQSTFNSFERMLPGNAGALATLAAQKYSADNQVLADEFRTNQAIQNDVINKNVDIINDAKLKNLGLADQQYQRQAMAIANTRNQKRAALNSISSKIGQNKSKNIGIRLRENLFDYRPDANYNMQHTGADYQFVNNSAIGNDVTTTYTDKYGNVSKKTVDSPLDEELKRRKAFEEMMAATKNTKKWGGIIK